MMEEAAFHAVYLLVSNQSQGGVNLTHPLPNVSHPFLPPVNHTPDVEMLLTSLMGARRKDLTSVMALTLVYCLLFLTGVVGNISTCIVIARNTYMHTVTNCYLFSLAVSDVLTLIFVAVVVAFFLCWAPYHAQRLMTLYIQPHQWTAQLLTVQSHLFYVSGVLYFLSSTVNPILYHVLSRKFRQAFKRTLCRCCLNLHSLPPFYKLQAKFVGGEGPPPHHSHHHHHHHRPTERGHFHPMKSLRVSKYSASLRDEARALMMGGGRMTLLGQPSTMESDVRFSALPPPAPSSSLTSGTHAHSDGRLLAICRHKNCSCRRGSVTGRGRRGGRPADVINDNNRRMMTSFPDVIPRRHRRELRGYCFDVTAHEHQQEEEEGMREVCAM